jgi:hypothetical protein
LSVVLVDASEPELLVLGGHLDETRKPLFEFGRPSAHADDEGDGE